MDYFFFSQKNNKTTTCVNRKLSFLILKISSFKKIINQALRIKPLDM